jgi:hypothetical protein
LDVLAGGMCAPVYLSWLARYGRTPGPAEWAVLAASGAVGWYMNPLVMIGAVALALFYQLWALRGVRFVWHLGLMSANVVGLAANGFWLGDWATHVWMFVPYGGGDTPPVSWPAAAEEWEAFLPADPVDLAVCALGLIGLLVMLRRFTTAAVLLASGALVYVAAGGAGRLWPVVAEVGAQRVLTVGVLCAVVPCAYGLTAIAGGIGASSGFRPLGFVWLFVGLAGLTYGLDLSHQWEVAPLQIGLGPEREEIVRTIRERTTPDGRILWEDRADEPGSGGGWTALLPELTRRPFLGGLCPDVHTDYLYARLAGGRLVNRPVADWTDSELARFCERYNVTRVVCRTPESTARFRQLAGAAVIAEFPGGAGVLFALDRRASYVLKGRATVAQMDWKRVALTDLEPDENGVVVLSLHHHAHWRVTPGYAVIERDVDVTDPVPMVRLRLPGPVARVTMTWKDE